MKVLLMVAGRSKRMKPVEDKNFLKFLGKPLIQWQIEKLLKNGFEEIVVVGRENVIEDMKKVFDELEVKADFAIQNDDKGMCGAVLAAKEFLVNDSFLVVSGNDVVEDSAFQLMKKEIEKGDAENFLLGKKVDEYFPGGYLETDENGFILNIIEKPGEGNEPSDLVNLVVHYFGDGGRFIDYLESAKSDNDDIYEVALADMMKAGISFKSVSYDGFWQAIKYPWHVMKVARHFFEISEKKIDDSAQISENAIVNGEVIIGKNVKIFDGAIVNGPAYIGDGSIIASNALVRDSFVGDNCVIGFSTEVARSYLDGEVWTHSNYVGDSVIGRNVSFGAGTVTGNLRLDEKNILVNVKGERTCTGESKFGLITGNNVRVGINTSFMPGVKIGGNSFIGAGIVVAQDIPEKSFVRGSWELRISENRAEADMSSRDEIKKKL